MADDKKGRDKQARDRDRRQRERDIAEELERWHEPEPPIDEAELDEIERGLEPLTFPATGAEIIAEIGNHKLTSSGEAYTVEELIPDTDVDTFESPAAVRIQVQRPTVADAMTDIQEAAETLRDETLRGSQRDAYKKTLLALKAVDAVDDDEGIQAVSDWIIEQIHSKETLPGSRAVRRQAASYCRDNGYQIQSDEWLGV